MNKSDLVKGVADLLKVGYKSDAKLIVDMIFDEMSSALARGESIEIRGFATFHPKRLKARVARNPKSGERVFVPDRAVVRFRPSPKLLAAINGGSLESDR